MNTFEVTASPRQAGDNAPFTFDRLHLAEDDLLAIRQRLYHSTGDGFHVFRQFITPEIVAHMRDIWSSVDPATSHQLYPGNRALYVGCPNYFARYADGSTIFYNFLFAPPLDEVTHEVSIAVHMLRNRLSGRNAFQDLWGERALSYRLTHNLNQTSWAPAHTDFMEYDRRWEKGQYDPSRLQATLFLSDKGRDYHGTGFHITTNRGEWVTFGDDVPAMAGDLVIWRYANLHEVADIATEPGRFGFMRIIYPVYDLPAEKPADPDAVLARKLARHGKAVARRVAGRLIGHLT